MSVRPSLACCRAATLAVAVAGCSGPRAGGAATVDVRVVVPASVAEPTGEGRLERAAHPGERGADGSWLLLPVTPGPLGRIAYGETRAVEVPPGLVTLEVRGFDEVECRGEHDTTDTASCWFTEWLGRATIAVDLPADLAAGADLAVGSGSRSAVDLVVRGCECEGPR